MYYCLTARRAGVRLDNMDSERAAANPYSDEERDSSELPNAELDCSTPAEALTPSSSASPSRSTKVVTIACPVNSRCGAKEGGLAADESDDDARVREPLLSSAEKLHQSGLYVDDLDGVRPTDEETLLLYHFDDIPERLKDNPFLLTGYRCRYTLSMCVRSIVSLHNETMNIWTHFLGFIGFFGLFVWLFTTVLEPDWVFMLLFAAFSAGLLVCLACSTCFHTMNAHYSSEVCKTMHKLDYFGITCLITGSYIPTICLTFACDPVWKWIYLSCCLSMGAFGLIGPWFHFWTEIKYRTFRLFVYTVLVGSGVVPIIHVNFLLPQGSVAPFVEGLALEISLYLCGMLVYSFCLPERLFPGKFDIWLHSHQIWHVFVLSAAAVHFFTLASMYVNWHLMSTEC